jgi:predicted esterase
MDKLKRKWLKELGFPSYTKASGQLKLISTFSHDEFDGEWYAQENGGGKTQRVLMAFPKNLKGKVPAVAVPFYYPEAMLGFNPKTGEKLEYFSGIEMMLHLLRRGYAVISADAYHLTYLYSDKEISDFTRWQESADALRRENPNYSGVGKLVDDTKLLIDALVSDARVDSDKIGIAGHSLGGKMAFYTGCLDERVKVILASDFGIGFNQTNWDDDWYFGKATVQKFIETNTFNSELLTIAKKPFCLIAGEYDTDESYEIISKAEGYTENSGLVKFINHKSGHRPPAWALNEGYDYIDKWLK